MRYTDEGFSSDFVPTIGIEFRVKSIMCGDSIAKLQIWDTAGQAIFRTITTAYYGGAMGMLIVYDVTDEQSFANVRKWMLATDQHCTGNVVRILIGNKSEVDPADRVSAMHN